MSDMVLAAVIEAGATPTYQVTLVNEQDIPVAASLLTTLTMTLWEATTRTILNARSDQNVLNANNCTFHPTSGVFTWVMQPADTAHLATTPLFEEHVMVLRWTWENGTRVGYHQVRFRIRTLALPPP